MNKKIFISLILFINLTSLALSDEQKSIKINKNKPLEIVSEQVTLIKDKQEIIFIKNVKAKQDKFKLNADKMTVKYNEDKYGKLKIKSIKTEDNVKFVSDRITATGDIGYYDLNKNIITLTDNVKAFQNGMNIEAEKFEYFVQTGKTNITGDKLETNKKQVTVILENSDPIK